MAYCATSQVASMDEPSHALPNLWSLCWDFSLPSLSSQRPCKSLRFCISPSEIQLLEDKGERGMQVGHPHVMEA